MREKFGRIATAAGDAPGAAIGLRAAWMQFSGTLPGQSCMVAVSRCTNTLIA
jgi:hypothetical protein